MESASGKICSHINQYHAASMLLIAWHFAKRKETVLAQLMQVDRLGFEVRCHFHGAVYSEERVNFPCGAIDNGKAMVEYITGTMRKEAGSHPKWPHGPLVNIVLAVYLLIVILYYESHGGEDLTFLPQT